MVTTNSDTEQDVNAVQKEDGEFLTEIEILPCTKSQFKRESSPDFSAEEFQDEPPQEEQHIEEAKAYDDQIENILTYFDADEMNADNKRHLKKLLEERNKRRVMPAVATSRGNTRFKEDKVVAVTKYFQRKRDFYMREIDQIKLKRAVLVLRAKKIRLEIDQLQNE